MPPTVLPDPIRQLDVAVVDEDLLWRVELMNDLRPLYADEAADVVAAADRIHPGDVTVVLLGPRLPETTGQAVADLRATHPNLRVVAVAGRVPPPGLPGVDLVVPADTAPAALVATVADVLADLRVEHEPPAPAPPSATPRELRDVGVVVVTAAKGGEGATLVAANLAVALAAAGAGAVAAVDTDAVFGDLALMFDLPPPAAGAAGAIGHQVVRHAASGVDVVQPPLPDRPLDPLAGDDLRSLLEAVAADHDVLVVDATPALVASSGLCEVADLVLVVATPRLASLKNASLLLPALHGLARAGHASVEVVLDGAERHEHDLRRVADALGAPVVGALPTDRGLADGVDRHVPGLLSHPHGGGARALRHLADHVAGRLPPAGQGAGRGRRAQVAR